MRLIKPLVFIFLSYLTIAQSAAAQGPSVEPYAKLPEKTKFVISPSGNFIAYRDTSEGRDIVVVIDMQKKALSGMVDVSSVKPRDIQFVSDNNLIMYVQQDAVLYGYIGKHRVSAAFAYNIAEKKFHQLLTPGKGIYSGQINYARVKGISPDEKYVYMMALQDESNWSLFKSNLDREAKPRLVQRGTRDTNDFFIDEKGEVIARERFSNEKNLHRVESKISGKWEVIYENETKIRTASFHGLTPDRKKLVMRKTSKETKRRAYYTLALDDGSIEGPVFEREDKDVESLIMSVNRIVAGVRYSGFEPSYEFFDPKLNARLNGIKNVLPGSSIWVRDNTEDWNNIILYSTGDHNAGEYLYYSNGSLTSLAIERPDIAQSDVNPVEEYYYKARDGLTIPTLITIPRGKEVKNLPAIMLPHGGPEYYDRKGFDYQAQYFASQGYLVIQPQFRGSTGFGLSHKLKGRGEWGRKMQDDLTDAVLALANAGKVDKSRVCIVGSSYGGYAALAGAVFTPDLYRCVVAINGVADVETMVKDEREDYGKDHWVVEYWDRVISKGKFDEDHLAQISPVNHADKIQAPVLLIHGEYDKVVPKKQSKKMQRAMNKAGKDVEYLELRMGDHYLSSAQNRMDAMKMIEEFVKKHI